jgi:hypothetical protein
MNLPLFTLEKDIFKWCVETLNKDPENRDKKEQELLIRYFHMAGMQKFQSVLAVILSADPSPLSEESVRRFCANQLDMNKENRNDEALKKIYQLAKDNDWGTITDNLESNHIVKPATAYMTVGTVLPRKYQPPTRPRSGPRPGPKSI